jgi:hypothetical protein
MIRQWLSGNNSVSPYHGSEHQYQLLKLYELVALEIKNVEQNCVKMRYTLNFMVSVCVRGECEDCEDLKYANGSCLLHFVKNEK